MHSKIKIMIWKNSSLKILCMEYSDFYYFWVDSTGRDEGRGSHGKTHSLKRREIVWANSDAGRGYAFGEATPLALAYLLYAGNRCSHLGGLWQVYSVSPSELHKTASLVESLRLRRSLL